MNNNCISAEFPKVPQNPRAAAKLIMDLLLHGMCPLLQKLRSKLQGYTDHDAEDEVTKIKNVFMLCSSQIKKCMLNFLDVIKMENNKGIYLPESRQFIFERLSWCITKLSDVEKNLDKCKLTEREVQETSEDDMFATPMYFVNWIDYTFEILAKLAEEIYRTDYKTNNKLYEEWKESMVEHVTSLHMCIDELLVSAMTLCKYCLPEDQTVLKARCQVVLRETTALFSELIYDDISTAVKVTKENLKLPIMPSNVNMMIDVLKDVLYVLETNTNTALLALLIHCFVSSSSPVDVLQDHFDNQKDQFCPCPSTVDEIASIEGCKIVKDFDLYNERLQQIGSFAVSCSSDQKRILTLRSCLSSLESLDPHLVPAVSTPPKGYHTELLSNFWKQEVLEIRDTVFLIVDPIAFVEKCKQYMRELLLEMQQQGNHDNSNLWVVMNIGALVCDFFEVYKKYEPDAIAHYENLDKQLENVNRAQKECQILSGFFSNNGASVYDAKIKSEHADITIDKFIARINLLYSMVKRVHELIRPKDSDEQLFGEEDVVNKNLTHTININTDTYSTDQRKADPNFTRSVFARTGVKSSTRNPLLFKLTQHLKKRVQDELSFSAQVSELFKAQNDDKMPFHDVRRAGEFSSSNYRRSAKKSHFPFMNKLECTFETHIQEDCLVDGKECALDETETLQISEILKQINDITTTISSSKLQRCLNYSTSAKPFDIPSRDPFLEAASVSNISNATQPSNFTTLERINDLDLVESKLSSLKANSDFETHL